MIGIGIPTIHINALFMKVSFLLSRALDGFAGIFDVLARTFDGVAGTESKCAKSEGGQDE